MFVERKDDVTGEDFDRAFAVASYLHPHGDTPTKIVLAAIAQLESARGTQHKRDYYYAQRETDSRPYKLRLDTTHLLQRLVLEQSERFERASERRGDCGEHEMLVRYVKHLVLLSMERNAFYATLAVARVLHDYTTREAMDLYGFVHDDASCIKEPYYYRSRRQRILQILSTRFGPRLRFVRATRGERQFVTVHGGDASGLVIEALERLTPWRVQCGACGGTDANDEITRLHRLFRPRCFAALASSLRLAAPPSRLRVPDFDVQRRVAAAS